MTMFIKITALAAIAIATTTGPASSETDDEWQTAERETAIAACIAFNGFKPAKLVEAAEDGLGDWLVWVEDKDGDYWLCNANAAGDVYANVMLEGDLLDGEGAKSLAKTSEDPDYDSGPAGKAERLCAAVGGLVDDLEIVVTVDDALGDYLVWLKNADGAYWMCNASADEKLYTFEPVQYPIEEQEPVEDDACCATEDDRVI